MSVDPERVLLLSGGPSLYYSTAAAHSDHRGGLTPHLYLTQPPSAAVAPPAAAAHTCPVGEGARVAVLPSLLEEEELLEAPPSLMYQAVKLGTHRDQGRPAERETCAWSSRLAGPVVQTWGSAAGIWDPADLSDQQVEGGPHILGTVEGFPAAERQVEKRSHRKQAECGGCPLS